MAVLYQPRGKDLHSGIKHASLLVRRILPGMWKQYKGIIILALIVGTGYGGHMLDRYMFSCCCHNYSRPR